MTAATDLPSTMTLLLVSEYDAWSMVSCSPMCVCLFPTYTKYMTFVGSVSVVGLVSENLATYSRLFYTYVRSTYLFLCTWYIMFLFLIYT